MNKKFPLFIPFFLLIGGCHTEKNLNSIVSIQMIDRNGFAETISNQDRLSVYQNVDFLSSQPYQKVLRVFKKDTEGKSHSKLTNYHSNGGVWQYLEALDGRANGRYLQWHENGKVKIEATVIDGAADLSETAQTSWLFDKECTIWDENGNVQAEFLYDKGYLEGLAKYYHPNGKLQKTLTYLHGKVNGTLIYYDENENIIEKINFNLGEKNGAAFGLWSLEVSKYQEQYRDGLIIYGIYYNKEGNIVGEIENGQGTKATFENEILHSLIQYQKGVPDGKIKIFDRNGNLESSYTIKEGKKHGLEWEYYVSTPGQSQPKLMLNWFEDRVQGMVKTWYENGILESQREMSGNKKHGHSIAYYKNGGLMLMEEYEHDKLVKGSYFKKGEQLPLSTVENGEGYAILHSPEGDFHKKITYEKGKPVPY